MSEKIRIGKTMIRLRNDGPLLTIVGRTETSKGPRWLAHYMEGGELKKVMLATAAILEALKAERKRESPPKKSALAAFLSRGADRRPRQKMLRLNGAGTNSPTMYQPRLAHAANI